MNYATVSVANDGYTDCLKRELDDLADAEAERDAAIYGMVHAMADTAQSNPAEQARLIDEAEINLYALRIRLHGESMGFERAICELLHMCSRRDDPEALKVAADAIRSAIDSEIRRDAGVYGMAAERVALGE